MNVQAPASSVHKSITVEAPVERAFHVFTAQIGTWWPPEHHILEGELVFQVDDELVTKRKGELAFAPRNVPHALTNRSDEPARYVLVCTPAGLERSFARMAAEQAGEEPPEWSLQPIPEVTQVGPQIHR